MKRGRPAAGLSHPYDLGQSVPVAASSVGELLLVISVQLLYRLERRLSNEGPLLVDGLEFNEGR